MTQIVDERLKKMCDECHSHLDKPCAWLSLGNEYCEEIMNIEQELQRKDNNWNELKEELKEARKELQPGELIIGQGLIDNILNYIKELENEKK